jgi:hypothetical protein
MKLAVTEVLALVSTSSLSPVMRLVHCDQLGRHSAAELGELTSDASA